MTIPSPIADRLNRSFPIVRTSVSSNEITNGLLARQKVNDENASLSEQSRKTSRKRTLSQSSTMGYVTPELDIMKVFEQYLWDDDEPAEDLHWTCPEISNNVPSDQSSSDDESIDQCKRNNCSTTELSESNGVHALVERVRSWQNSTGVLDFLQPTEDEKEALKRVRALGEQLDETESLEFLRNSATSVRKNGHTKLQNDILRLWFFANQMNPYPTSKMKQRLMKETGFTFQQLRNWFSNIRKRHWIPLTKGLRRPKSQIEIALCMSRSSSRILRTSRQAKMLRTSLEEEEAHGIK
jgi:hypothetical protein